jgi:pyruvate formate lyase activating enzyme
LALADSRQGSISHEEILQFLRKREGLLEAIVISGGEPTLQPGLEEFLSEIRPLNYLIKLDTNGYQPQKLERLLALNLLDYVAMDLKNTPEKYAETCGLPNLNSDLIRQSIRILKNSGVQLEFRTTVVRELHEANDFIALDQWEIGDSPLILQTFRDGPTVMKTGLHAYGEEDMITLAKEAKERIPGLRLRREANQKNEN